MELKTLRKAELHELYGDRFATVDVDENKVTLVATKSERRTLANDIWPDDLIFMIPQSMKLYPDGTPIDPLKPLIDGEGVIGDFIAEALVGKVGVIFGDYTPLIPSRAEETGCVGAFEVTSVDDADYMLIIREWDMRDDPDGLIQAEVPEQQYYYWTAQKERGVGDKDQMFMLAGREFFIVPLDEDKDPDAARVRQYFQGLAKRIDIWCNTGNDYKMPLE